MILFDDVTKHYADGTLVVDRLSFSAPTGKLTILVGPSGCGKTTSLRMINRLIQPSSGKILLNGQSTAEMDVVQLRRKIGYVIQSAGLFPHKTIVDNVAVTARLNGASRHTARKTALELLERVGLSAALAQRYPWQLSGGQQQRVGVARALASDPEFMLMDEPFSAVDPVVREQLQDEFLRLQRDIGKTIIMVTHDIDEAMKLGDRIAVLRPGGRLAQIASPAELLNAPRDPFVADFIGRDRGYRKLTFSAIHPRLALQDEPAIALGSSTAEARNCANGRWVLVVEEGRPLGWFDLNQPREVVGRQDLNLGSTFAPLSGSLRQLTDAVLSSPCQRGIVVDEQQKLLGSVNMESVLAALQNHDAGDAL
ncbi:MULTISPECIES: ABC transporter ATP-binding protein [Brenneria]|uniref:ATP-binding cassette domain-containing protein n=1 Tax=Brenneria nigrifluens DSM 30175 = ATCC 13028 TaxID=1121120 RepID=A0A2U1UFF0_9GAMM|nr:MULTISPECIES: ATP-binding cassette domain-containing protein [Brenneria]EHD19990.1 Polyamine-transporting ATPase [Brenneria sp. EniD312]PWC20383.1 glycine/betaine ABC transporter ATP-binding protein [Brenneria nigrifluens DSM 30175 = ATCC 13028]QCR03229.1 ATP-binding cassette domain-containing protein [Brenneria nigrifluens DSM 30175 = ATCC 13028]